MARMARVEVFAADEIAVVHVMARTVRRCCLLGEDAVTGKNYDHRKQWLDDQLVHQARHFGIDLLCQAIMSNHIHLVVRSRPDVVAEWDDSEVARRWLMLRVWPQNVHQSPPIASRCALFFSHIPIRGVLAGFRRLCPGRIPFREKPLKLSTAVWPRVSPLRQR